MGWQKLSNTFADDEAAWKAAAVVTVGLFVAFLPLVVLWLLAALKGDSVPGLSWRTVYIAALLLGAVALAVWQRWRLPSFLVLVLLVFVRSSEARAGLMCLLNTLSFAWFAASERFGKLVGWQTGAFVATGSGWFGALGLALALSQGSSLWLALLAVAEAALGYALAMRQARSSGPARPQRQPSLSRAAASGFLAFWLLLLVGCGAIILGDPALISPANSGSATQHVEVPSAQPRAP
jgi:hypothetical protein